MNNCPIKFAVKAFLSLLLIAGATTASGQDAAAVVGRLSVPDGPGGASITVTEKGEAASIVRMASSARRNTRVNGYRVRIFFDNKQNARGQANAALNRFRELYPGIPADMKYDVPDFKVTAGYCLTNEEAIILWGRIKNQFPKAFLIPEEIPLSAFTYEEILPEEPASQESAQAE
ncbi:MAG: hypothetical protein LUF87_03870 [Alistipes sp.]|nr:hypothetical protein [Alistipes sp.]